MLVADIHGKIVPESHGSEDYLTSAVIGHLRYVPPGDFWRALFAASRSNAPGGPTLADELWPPENPVGGYSGLSVRFWPREGEDGEPDLILEFSGPGRPAHLVLVEAKLWSGKGGTGDRDQLVRYLRVLDRLVPGSSQSAGVGSRCLVYLTPRDSTEEVEDSLRHAADPARERRRTYRLQWQDVLVAAEGSPGETEPAKTILRDIALFLRRRGLEYFVGFRHLPDLPDIETVRAAFTEPDTFFFRVSLPQIASVRRAGWVDG